MSVMVKPFFIRKDRALIKINPADVVALHTEGNYTKVFISNDRYFMIRSTLSGALKKLPSDMFIRIHRATIASVNFIDAVYRDHVVMQGLPVPVGKQYYQSLINKLNIIE